jgi:5-(carboxyamino)imidazole ribonucleotide synthase
MSDIQKLTAPIAPGGTIGILGGGQLGRMLALAAARLGLKAHIYCDHADACAFQVSDARTHAAYEDQAALAKFADACDAITTEFENIPEATVAFLATRKPVNPNARALAIAQDRFDEKNFLLGQGLRTAHFADVSSAEDAKAALEKTGSPAILKTRRMGYDGKGQAKVSSVADVQAAFEKFGRVPCILEGFVPFAFEASVIAARSANGDFAAYDPPENFHEHHILRRSTVPARLADAQADAAKAYAEIIAKGLDYVGVLAVELFVTDDWVMLVNEIAPRVHNSGHWTLEACAVSQFEQHIRAVAGWPLGDPRRHCDAVMENIIGEEANDWEKLASRGGALHLYGKSPARPGRKMGHITRLSPMTSPR